MVTIVAVVNFATFNKKNLGSTRHLEYVVKTEGDFFITIFPMHLTFGICRWGWLDSKSLGPF
jgi:hypothetical protein